MQEIGDKLRQVRKEMELTLDEVASDLNQKTSFLKHLENGNYQALKKIFNLKQIISDYAKYLGLDYEKIEDEYDEFVFGITSKIPALEIAKASEENKKAQEQIKKIISPYTIDFKKPSWLIKLIIWLLFILIIIVGFLIVKDVVGF